jgi:hypothetical protein
LLRSWGGDLGGDGKCLDASRRNWKAPDNKLLEILFMFTGNFVYVHWNFFYWKFCSCLLEMLFMFTGKKNCLVLRCIKDDPLERFCVSVCLATAVESARIILAVRAAAGFPYGRLAPLKFFSGQAQTWPNCPPTRIVQDTSACAFLQYHIDLKLHRFTLQQKNRDKKEQKSKTETKRNRNQKSHEAFKQ